jgi:hypothetical protein
MHHLGPLLPLHPSLLPVTLCMWSAHRASPRRKVFTLSTGSLQTAADARQCAVLEATAAADPTTPPLGPLHTTTAAAAAEQGGSSGTREGHPLSQAWENFAAGKTVLGCVDSPCHQAKTAAVC